MGRGTGDSSQVPKATSRRRLGRVIRGAAGEAELRAVSERCGKEAARVLGKPIAESRIDWDDSTSRNKPMGGVREGFSDLRHQIASGSIVHRVSGPDAGQISAFASEVAAAYERPLVEVEIENASDLASVAEDSSDISFAAAVQADAVVLIQSSRQDPRLPDPDDFEVVTFGGKRYLRFDNRGGEAVYIELSGGTRILFASHRQAKRVLVSPF